MNTQTSIQDLISQAAAELSDAAHRRWSSDTLVAYVNEGLRLMADEGMFRRAEVFAVKAGQGAYRTVSEVVCFLRVFHEGKALRAIGEDEAVARRREFFDRLRGRPAAFLPLADGVRLYPLPDADGVVLSLPDLPGLDEDAGAKIDGDGWIATRGPDGVEYFREDDPGAPNLGGDGALYIEYAYYPRPSVSTDSVPTRLAEALRLYVLHRCLATSDASDEIAQAARYLGLWDETLLRLSARTGAKGRSDALWFAPLVAV